MCLSLVWLTALFGFDFVSLFIVIFSSVVVSVCVCLSCFWSLFLYLYLSIVFSTCVADYFLFESCFGLVGSLLNI